MTFVVAWLAKHWRPLAVVLLLAFVGWRIHAHGDAGGGARVQARWNAQEALYATQRAEATIAARVLEQRHRDEMRAVTERFLTDQRKADEEHEAAVAALRSGAVRLRERFTCPAAAGMPAGAADPGSPDDPGARGLQREDSELLLRLGDEADAVARRLNALIAACATR